MRGTGTPNNRDDVKRSSLGEDVTNFSSFPMSLYKLKTQKVTVEVSGSTINNRDKGNNMTGTIIIVGTVLEHTLGQSGNAI